MYTHIACSNGNEVFKLIIIVVISSIYESLMSGEVRFSGSFNYPNLK